jgi:hypothetical protein
LDDLTAFRIHLQHDGRSPGTHLCVLAAVRPFLLWEHNQGAVALTEAAIRNVLTGRTERANRRVGVWDRSSQEPLSR